MESAIQENQRGNMRVRSIWQKCICLAAGLLAAGLLAGCGQSDEKIQSAMAMIKDFDYQGALAELDTAQEEGENLRLINRARGIAHIGLTEYEEAIQCFREALAGSNGLVEDVDFDLNYYLAAAYAKDGQYALAEETYDAILTLRPNEVDACFLRGNARMNLAKYEEAREDFDRAIALVPGDYDMLIEIYEILDQFGYQEDGREYLQTALSVGGKNMDNYVIGRIHYYLGDYERAYLALEQAKDKGNEESYLYLGRAYEATGDYNYAANVYNSYLNVHSGSAELYNQLGLCEMARGDYQKALEAFQAGMKLEDNPILQTLSFNEIVAYEHLGRFDTASALMHNYLNNYPDDELARREYNFLVTR